MAGAVGDGDGEGDGDGVSEAVWLGEIDAVVPAEPEGCEETVPDGLAETGAGLLLLPADATEAAALCWGDTDAFGLAFAPVLLEPQPDKSSAAAVMTATDMKNVL